MSTQNKNLLVTLIKKSVGLPTASSSACCGTSVSQSDCCGTPASQNDSAGCACGCGDGESAGCCEVETAQAQTCCG
ncbi:MAG: hypothetical protein QY332_05520 [Anaerolineales bacterium]|nr:MAG: hypothetical protein QY332_05520 [Anaerolineales bacterium]